MHGQTLREPSIPNRYLISWVFNVRIFRDIRKFTNYVFQRNLSWQGCALAEHELLLLGD